MQNNNEISLQNALEDKSYFLNEIAAMTQTGGYGCNLITGAIILNFGSRDLLGIPHDYEINIDNVSRFFANKKVFKKLIGDSLKGNSTILDLEMNKFDGERLWVRFNCHPFLQEDRVVGLRGVFTSVDRYIKNTQEVENAALVIKAQNERLVHFAHILSHNLRSHASNLQLTLQTFDDVKEPSDVEVFNSYLNDISFSLNQTLHHLNEVVTINTELKIKENIDIEAIFNRVLLDFEEDIKAVNATVTYDFAELLSIEYVPSFLESVFRNLISNAIKYRDLERPLKIVVKTKSKNKRKLLIIRDNGIGIDLKRHAGKLFHMYRTFHTNDDARGVGLFLVKSKVEALGGDISVKSELGKGSTFSIRFE
ncbi:sensor histidine kinase [Nonlabens ulvanivorans]|uniref:sensor histidine kinase n=3 Tax=Nonlabens ulvanivorans TaxID=906888 RepID=UPI002942C0A8|nr:HAMP domain-containing sensor histidine kinase [Nonlabens ulvanivorans]WOI22625.1 HAMP domain-containing sensor histidine kinase [Nonlabens ulvanivorans]